MFGDEPFSGRKILGLFQKTPAEKSLCSVSRRDFSRAGLKAPSNSAIREKASDGGFLGSLAEAF